MLEFYSLRRRRNSIYIQFPSVRLSRLQVAVLSILIVSSLLISLANNNKVVQCIMYEYLTGIKLSSNKKIEYFHLRMLAILYRFKSWFKKFNPTEKDVNVDSFATLTIFLLRLIGFNFKQLPLRPKCRDKILHALRFSYFNLIIVCAGIALISKAMLALMSENLSASLPLVLDVVTYSLNMFKISITYLRKDDIWRIIQDVRRMVITRQAASNTNYDTKNYLRKYHKIMFSISIPMMLISFLNLLPIIPFLLFGSMHLTVEYWYPFDAYQVRNFPIAYIWVNWIGITFLAILFAADTLLYALLTIFTMEFEILKLDLMNILETPKDVIAKRLQSLVDRHNNLLNLSRRLVETFSTAFFFSFIISSVFMCFLSHLLSKSFDNPSLFAFYFVYFWMMAAPIFVLCLFAQKLSDSSKNVSEGAYNCGWEKINDETFKKQLILIILRSQRARQLTAMGFVHISLETFTKVS